MKTEPVSQHDLQQIPDGDSMIAAVYERLTSIERHLCVGQAPQTWSVEDIGVWLGLSKHTTGQRVVTRPGFPDPIVPAGITGAQKRWFADEIIEWFRKNRGSLPKARAGRAGGISRGRGRPRGSGAGRKSGVE